MDAVIKKKSIGSDDLTEGPIVKKLLLFFLPIVAGTLFQQLYNAADALVVGKYVGTGALAAVGGSPAVTSNLVIGFCTSLAGGASVVISQLYGAKEYKAITDAVKTSFLFCALLGLLAGGIVMALSPQILLWMKTPEDTLADALVYQRIYFSASSFMLIYNMGSGILRAVGNSKFPFFCLCVSCGLNIALDFTFVLAFDMGVAGVAWATVIAQAVSAALVTAKLLLTKESYRLHFIGANFDLSLFKKMLGIGVPSGLQSSMYGISNIILQIGVNKLGTLAAAAWAMSTKVDGVFWATTSAFGIALTTFVGQNYGAKNYARVRKTAKSGFWLLGGMTVFVSTFIMTLGRFIMSFMTDDQALIDTTFQVMSYFVPLYILWTVIEVCTGVLRGIGDVIVPSVILGLGICLFRILWIYLMFSMFPALWSLCLSYPLSWAITGLALFLYYRKKSKRLKIAGQEKTVP